MSLKVDDHLEKNQTTNARSCLQNFICKGGTLETISSLSDTTQSFSFSIGDVIYPVCSGGWCRSQALWALLRFCEDIILFPPHAARVGWDPYNGQINRYRNVLEELKPDEFSLYFGIEKALRFGFENSVKWKLIEQSTTQDELTSIATFYDQHYYGPLSSESGINEQKRIYVTFSNNTHVVLYRLNQTNVSLKNVTVISIDSEDIITYPPNFLQATSRSKEAYKYFSTQLVRIFNLTKNKFVRSLIEKSHD
jgi:hypothetical protein